MKILMKNVLILVLLLTSTLLANAQYKMKYGKIDNEDVKMTTYEADPGAEAVVLGETMNVAFTIRSGHYMLIYRYHTRIKVLSKKGIDRANVEVQYWGNRRSEKITNIKAQTINWKNGKIEKTEVQKDDFFDEKKSKNIYSKKFAFPAVEVGSVLEYTYELSSDYFISVNDHFFQKDIPVVWSDYKVKVHEAFDYRPDYQGKNPFSINTKKAINVNQGPISFSGTEYHWRMENLPALKREPYITSMYDYYSAVRMRLANFLPQQGFHQYYIGTWEQMNQRYFEEIATKSYLKPNFADVVWKNAKKEIAGIDKPLKKTEALYKFVQKNIEWDGSDEINPDHTADYCYREKEGSNTEINLTLLALLKKAGIDAYPLLVSTRDNGKPMNFLSYLYQFNQTLIVAIIDEKAYYLDASHKEYPMDILHPNNLNIEGWMIVNEGKGQWIRIQPSKNKEVILPTLTLSADGTVEGTIQTLSKGYAAMMNRQYVNDEGKESYLKESYLENLPDAEIENHKFLGFDNVEEQLKESMDFSSTDMAQVAGDMIYLNPFVVHSFGENPFKTEKREIPVDMPFGMDKQAIIKIAIPEGYTVETLPEITKIVLPNKGASFMYAASEKGNMIQIICKMKFDQTYYTEDEYTALREFVAAVIQKEEEQIVLKKM